MYTKRFIIKLRSEAKVYGFNASTKKRPSEKINKRHYKKKNLSDQRIIKYHFRNSKKLK